MLPFGIHALPPMTANRDEMDGAERRTAIQWELLAPEGAAIGCIALLDNLYGNIQTTIIVNIVLYFLTQRNNPNTSIKIKIILLAIFFVN